MLGVSTDTARRWADAGTLKTRRTRGGQRIVDGGDLAAFLRAEGPIEAAQGAPVSARNRFTGIVTNVIRDNAAASVEIHTGSARIVSLMTREAADDLALEPGMLATASVKATNVIIGLPRGRTEP